MSLTGGKGSRMKSMEAVILIGIQATGKSTFYKDCFSGDYVHVNLDTLKTRRREMDTLLACIAAKQSFVVDNTNVTVQERARYIDLAKPAGYRITGYYFCTSLKVALERNRRRNLAKPIPDQGVIARFHRLQPPTLEEGFDKLYTVALSPEGSFEVQLLSAEN